MKINKIIKFILIMLISFCTIQFLPNNTVEAASKPNLKITYSYNSKTDIVTVKVKSNIKLKKTKPSWTLSKDKKTYSKKFYVNETYSTKFTAQNGKSKTVRIKVKQIKGPKVTVSYKYDKNTNKVKVTINSNKELKKNSVNNKWTLSKNKKTFTRVFSVNTKFNVILKDKYENKTKKEINVTGIDKTGPKMTIKYSYNSINNTVTVIATSNEELKNTKPTWTLSKNKKVYTKIYTKNEKLYTTEFQDRYGNKTKANIQVVQVDDKGPQVTITTKYNSDKRSAVVTIVSNEELYNIDSTWTLANNKKTCEIKYKRNGTYNIVLQDKWGNKTNKIIKISGLIAKGIDVSQHNSRINWAEVQKEGIDFVILRLGWVGNKENHTLDTYFKENYESCVRLGIPVGVYVYSYCENEETVKSAAKWTAEQLKGKKITYPVFIDMEDSQIENLDVQTLTDISKTFCEELKTSGYSKVGIYANKNWLVNKLDVSQLSKYSIWLAHYTDKTDYSGKYDMWQYTSSGTVNGIIGNVDMNYSYKIY